MYIFLNRVSFIIMKKILLISVGILATGLIFIFLFFPISSSDKDAIHIAMMGPMSGPNKLSGEECVEGILMCLDEINKAGGIRGRKIKLLTYDDKSDKRAAVKAAHQVAEEGKMLLVIGHYYSTISIDAGKIYKKAGIPAITSLATAESVTSGNEWYFRTVPNNALYAHFIANYSSEVLKKTSAGIIFVNDDYGIPLAGNFEKTSRKLGVRIIKKWGVDATIKDRDSEEQIIRIVQELKETEDVGILFLATYSYESAEIIATLEHWDINYPVIGNSLSGTAFSENLKKYSLEENLSVPIYAASPFLADIGNEKTYKFRQKFLEKYGEEPSVTAVCAYDAAYVAVEAIKKAGTEGRGHIREDRRKVRRALTSFYDYENAVKGVTGSIYFNANGDVIRPPAMGIYENQTLHPLFSQYHLTDIRGIDNLLEESLAGELIEIDGQAMRKTRVINVGMDINEIKNLNVKNSVATLDFYLWFRYKEDFDGREIIFVNAVKPITLGQPISDIKRNNVVTRVYRVTADFKSDSDFRMYPFEQHTLKVKLRHSRLTREKLILVTDVSNTPELAEKKSLVTIQPDAATGWIVTDTSFYQDIISNTGLGVSGLQDTMSYSRINAAIRIERKGLNFAFRNFLPVIIMIIVLYAIYFIRPDRFGFRVTIFMAVFIANAYCHIMFASKLPLEYLCVIEYAFFAVYILAVIALFTSVSGYLLYRKGDFKKVRLIEWSARIVYPFVVSGGGLGIMYLCMS